MKKIFPGLLMLAFVLPSFGQFTKKASTRLSGDEITFVTWANIDNDTFPEAIALVKKASYTCLYAIKFSSTKADTTLIADSIASSSPPALLDWNGDHLLDFAFPTTNSQNILLLISKGDLTFTKVKTTIGSIPISKIEPTNLTNDETKQFLLKKATRGWSVFTQKENNFNLIIDSTLSITDFKSIDLDGNGYNDLVLSGEDSNGKPYLKIIELMDSLRTLRTINLPDSLNGTISSADLNDDGLFDLVVAGNDKLGKTIIRSYVNKDSLFIRGIDYPSLANSKITLADFDSDGEIDYAVLGTNTNSQTAHWIKTFAGDSINLPSQNVTSYSYGDYDRDGDLDLMLATDTLGLVVHENMAIKNIAPQMDINWMGAFIFNRLFLAWNDGIDDHTNPLSLTYELYLTHANKVILNGEFDLHEGLRQTFRHGNLTTNNFYLMKKSAGPDDFAFSIEAIDNSLYAEKKSIIGGGIGNGGGNICVAKISNHDITVCNDAPVTITSTQPVLWFSFEMGFLGKSTSLKVKAKSDTIFSVDQPIKCDGSINIYVIKKTKIDTVRITQNFTGCENSTLAFTVADEWSNVNWKDTKGNSKGSGNALDYKILKDETIIGIGSNSNGCFIKQTENIKLSKPNLALEGTDYRIHSGSSATLGASGGQTYLWQPAAGLNDASSPNPIASPNETTTYTVTAFDSLNCSAQGKVLVEVFNSAFVPNLFSPNGDGKNDELKIYGLSDARNFHFSVYNREGSTVYESSDWTNVNWDGTKNGTQQPSGLYYWKVEGSFANGQPLRLNEKTKGSVLLVR